MGGQKRKEERSGEGGAERFERLAFKGENNKVTS